MTTNQIVRSTCNFCQIGCGVLVHLKEGVVVKVEGDPASPLNKGILCTKGLATVEYVYHPDRLKHPLKRVGERGENKWQQISWDEALTTIAGRLAETKEKYGAESVAFSVGAAKTGAAYPRRFATAFGTPNVSWQGHVCFAPRMTASRLTYGFYAVPDYENPPKCLVVWGVNLAANLFHVRIRAGQAVGKGAKLIVIDPRPIDLTARADLWLKVRPGSDLALALAMINVIINEELYDKDFVEKWTVGFDRLKAHVQQYTPEWAAGVTWLPAEKIREAARTYAANRPAGIQWGNGIDHGVNSLQTARAIAILKAITGNLNIPGGESEWTVPLAPLVEEQPIPSVRVPEDRWAKRVGTEYATIPSIKRILPQRLVKAILDEKPYPIRALYIQGANPLLSFADAQETYRALKKVNFLVVADLFMTPTAAMADFVLPAASYLEFDAVVSPPYSNAAILAQQKVTRVGECRSDFEILAGLAEKLGLGEHFGGTEEELADVILKPSGLTFQELKQKVGGIAGTMKYKEYEESGFATPSGKVEIYSSLLEGWGYDPLPTYREQPESPLSEPELASEYPLVFTSGKSASYRHSGGRQIKSLRADHPEPLVNINPEMAKKLGIADGDMVYIETKRGRIKQKASLTRGMDPRVVVVDYAWWFPEKGAKDLYGWAEANINILTDGDPPYNREIGSTNLRGIVCKVYKEG
ncbi:MAG: molybdopterin-dependent oxidoreductase [Chloroflexota bacterium]